jgi:hypothetical protein
MSETVELKKNLPPPAETKPEEKGLSDDACVSRDRASLFRLIVCGKTEKLIVVSPSTRRLDRRSERC